MTRLEQTIIVIDFLKALGYDVSTITLKDSYELKTRILTNITESVEQLGLVSKMGHQEDITDR